MKGRINSEFEMKDGKEAFLMRSKYILVFFLCYPSNNFLMQLSMRNWELFIHSIEKERNVESL